MNFINRIVIAVFIFVGFNSCKEHMKATDREAAKEAALSQEIKKVSEAELMAKGFEIGRKVTNAAQQVLGKTLKEHINAEGVNNTLKFCNMKAYPLVDSLSGQYQVQIRRVSSKFRNPRNRPDSIEAILLDSYTYQNENNQPLPDNIQEISKDQLLYTKPILIGDAVCLNCHGAESGDINEETRQTLHELYPGDLATGYAITEFRGMWAVRISKKGIVKSL